MKSIVEDKGDMRLTIVDVDQDQVVDVYIQDDEDSEMRVGNIRRR